MTSRGASSWQVILADLSLILFLTTLAGLVAARDREPGRPRDPAISQPYAVYREFAGGTGFGDWLSREVPDSRAQLTIFARYKGPDRAEIWQQAQVLAHQAILAGYQPRIIAEAGDASDVYASLAYDAVGQELVDQKAE